MAIGQGPIKKPGTPPKDAKRLIGDALVGQVKAELSGNSAVGAQNRAQVANAARAVGRVPQAMASGLNQANPGAPTTPLRSPSEVAGGLAAGVQGAGGAVGGVMASGLNQVNPNAPVTSRGANDLAGAMLQHGAQNSIAAGQGPANVRPSTGIGANFGANLQGRLDGTIGSRASGGVPGAPPPSATMGPPPAKATNGRPDFPQLGGVAPPGAYTSPSGTAMRAGPAGSVPAPQLPPFSPTQSTDLYAGAEAQQFGEQGVLPTPQPTPGYAAPSGQRMMAGPGAPSSYTLPPQPQGPAPIQGPSMDGYQGPFLTRPLQSLAGDEAIRSLQNSGMLGERIGQTGTNMAPTGAPGPLGQALLDGQKPITSPTGPGMANDLRAKSPGGQLTNEQAAQVYRNAPADSKPDIRTTVGGRYGGAGDTPLPFEKGPAPKAQPLGGYAKNDADFGSRMVGENRFGNFGGTLPVKGADGKPTFADGPMKDFGMKPSGQFETDANGRTTKKGGYSSMELQAQADAKATFDARRGGLEARKAAYEARNAPGARAMQARDNPTPRQINSQGRAQARSENRRYQQGKLTMGERLAFANPDAASRTALGKAQIDANNQRAGSQDQFRLAQLQQQEQNNIRNNQTARENSQDRLQGQYAAGGMAPPAKPGEAPAPAKPATPGDVKLMPKADGYAALKEQHGPEAANRMMNEIHGTNDWNYEQYPNGPTAMTGLIDGMTGGNGYRVPPQAPPPAGSPNRAKMGGGMQLPPKGKPRPNSLGEDLVRGRWGAFEH